MAACWCWRISRSSRFCISLSQYLALPRRRAAPIPIPNDARRCDPVGDASHGSSRGGARVEPGRRFDLYWWRFEETPGRLDS
ncbi:hypothetical protein B0H19DRAFT_1139131 [Mycena capillaripes]|nr:hypothetical protein B0H19DRAFT_1139131 [Mycena capillaripes]